MITKNYIKMCEKAGEIQKWYFNSEDERLKNNWLWEYDIFACKEHRTIFRNYQTVSCPAVKGNLCNRRSNKIWLPTQEQLQEMILKIFSPFAKIIKLSEFVSNYVKLYKDTKYESLYWVGLYPTAIESMNEFWLMYVMYEKYKKIWTGKKWVKE